MSVTTETKDNSIEICFGNLANAFNDESSDTYRFGKRENNLHKLLKNHNFDVFCASELRICMDENKTTQLTPSSIAHRISTNTQLELADCRPQNLDAMAFWRATFYNKKNVVPLVSGCEWAIPPVFGSNIVAERGVMVMFTQFKVLSSNKLFWTINSHMPLAKTEKLKTIEWLNNHAESICEKRWNDKSPIIFYGGDQNTFWDNDDKGDGNDMMDEFKKGWTHLTNNIKISFKSFPHDKFQGTSLLDHIFVNKSAIDKIKLIESKSIDTTPTSNCGTVSDHYFLSIIVNFV